MGSQDAAPSTGAAFAGSDGGGAAGSSFRLAGKFFSRIGGSDGITSAPLAVVAELCAGTEPFHAALVCC